MKFKRIDLGLTKGGLFYRTRFSSVGPEIVDIDVDVGIDIAHRDPECRKRQEEVAMEQHGISETDLIAGVSP